jgi:hypothetical protein
VSDERINVSEVGFLRHVEGVRLLGNEKNELMKEILGSFK